MAQARVSHVFEKERAAGNSALGANVADRVARLEMPQPGKQCSGAWVCYPDGYDPLVHPPA